MWHSKLNKCDSGVVGNARPCQGRDRGFEPRLSLLFDEKGHPERMSFFVERGPSGAQSSSVSVSLRSAQSRCPPDTLRRLSLNTAVFIIFVNDMKKTILGLIKKFLNNIIFT